MSFGSSRFGSMGGGGGAITPGVAYIQTNGNDATGEIGNPAKPFETAQAAFDLGARIFHIGCDVTTEIVVAETGLLELALFVTGCGLADSNFSVFASSDDVNLRVRSNHTCQFAAVEGNATTGDCYVEVYALVLSNFNATSDEGTATAKAAFCEVGTDSSGLLATSSQMSIIEAASIP